MFISIPRPRVEVPYLSGPDFDPHAFASSSVLSSNCQKLEQLSAQWHYLKSQQLNSMPPGTSSRRSKSKPKRQSSKDQSQQRQRRATASADTHPNPNTLGLVDSSFLPTSLSHPEQTNNFVWTPAPPQQQQHQSFSATSSTVSVPSVGLASYDSSGSCVYVGDQTQTFVKTSASPSEHLVPAPTDLDYPVFAAVMNRAWQSEPQHANALAMHSFGFPLTAMSIANAPPQMPFVVHHGQPHQMISGGPQTSDLTGPSDGTGFATYPGSHFGSFSSTCATFEAMALTDEPSHAHPHHQHYPWQMPPGGAALVHGGVVGLSPPGIVLASQHHHPLAHNLASGVPRSAASAAFTPNSLTVSPKLLKNRPSPTPTPTPATSTESMNAAFFREQREIEPLILPAGPERPRESPPSPRDARTRLPDQPRQRQRAALMKPPQLLFQSGREEAEAVPTPRKTSRPRAASPLPGSAPSHKRRLSRTGSMSIPRLPHPSTPERPVLATPQSKRRASNTNVAAKTCAKTESKPETKSGAAPTKPETSAKPATKAATTPITKVNINIKPKPQGKRNPTSDSDSDSEPSPNASASNPQAGSQGGFSSRRKADRFLLASRRSGMTYKEIRATGGFTEAESTLRGRFRTLTKPPEKRVRDPQWTDKDLRLLDKAVRKYVRPASSAHSATGFGPDSLGWGWSEAKVPWKQVAQYIVDRGGSYHFGNSTCRKKWDELLDGRACIGGDEEVD